MKTLIAGLGSIGRRHLRNLVALGEQDILLYRTHTSTLPDDELDPYPVEKDLTAALAYQPDAVIVSNPTALHLDVAIPAARVGCHLLLEKPISHTMERVDELVSIAKQNRIKTIVGFQFRFHPGLRTIRRILKKGEVGKPLSVRAHWGEYLPDWHPWEDYHRGYAARQDLGGGVIRTLCHPFDYLRMLFGDVKAIWCFSGKHSDMELEVEDTAEIGMQFTNGVIGSVHLDYVQRPPRHDLEIVGTAGTIRWDSTDGAAHIYSAEEDRWQTIPIQKNFKRNHLFLAEMQNFIAMVKGDEAAECTLDDGVIALKMALAALTSAKDKKMVSVSSP